MNLPSPLVADPEERWALLSDIQQEMVDLCFGCLGLQDDLPPMVTTVGPLGLHTSAMLDARLRVSFIREAVHQSGAWGFIFVAVGALAERTALLVIRGTADGRFVGTAYPYTVSPFTGVSRVSPEEYPGVADPYRVVFSA